MLRFTEDDIVKANQAWGCNCGPAALAFITDRTLEDVRPACDGVGFDVKRYMNPTMMAEALRFLCHRFVSLPNPLRLQLHRTVLPNPFLPSFGLVRIQLCGPWTELGANPKWAYRHTHWIAVVGANVFDVNSGECRMQVWEKEVAPAIAKSITRANGKFFVTHSWNVFQD